MTVNALIFLTTDVFNIVLHSGTYKVRNEIETKRNEINENETKQNQQKRNETKRNENEIKRNQRKQNEINENKTK